MSLAEIGVKASSANSCSEITNLLKRLEAFSMGSNAFENQVLILKNQLLEKRKSLSDKIKNKKETDMHVVVRNSKSFPKNEFVNSFLLQMSQMDGAAFASGLAVALVMLSATIGLSVFVIFQTHPLYVSLKYDLPFASAVGAIFIAFTFSALHCVKPSFKSKVACIAVCIYEFFLVGSGTQVHEQDLLSQKISESPRIQILQDQVKNTQYNYSKLNIRYTDPKDKMFDNQWFFKNHVSPALGAFDAAEKALTVERSSLLKELGSLAGYLKLSYRVLLIVLLMTLTHYAVLATLSCFRWRE